MQLEDSRVLVTGGAGFVGSHLVESLLDRGTDVTVVDDLSNGRREWTPNDAVLVDADLTDPDVPRRVVDADVDAIFHLAARKDPNDDDPRGQFRANTTMTHELLRAARAVGVTKVAYTSSSTVYGEAPRPTPESYGPLEPISVYGAGKLAEEGLLSTYAHSHGFTVWNYRFANIVGPRLRGAVVPDFVEKLRADPERLEILGDGRQEKSYLHVEDCVDAMCHVIEYAGDPQSELESESELESDPDSATDAGGSMYTYNLGTETTTSVTRIADIVSDVLGLDPDYEYTGGDRGWTGDVPRMRLAIEKLAGTGWEPTHESDEAIRRAATELAAEIERAT